MKAGWVRGGVVKFAFLSLSMLFLHATAIAQSNGLSSTADGLSSGASGLSGSADGASRVERSVGAEARAKKPFAGSSRENSATAGDKGSASVFCDSPEYRSDRKKGKNQGSRLMGCEDR